ncbi:uncharacterized protein LOC143600465 [Bidens hawaiensis]|uniref:uncharacterized protein LOC143600465 n=1 Tax=Bidens hawaiensis TaxID=980011 RepID=UPI004049F161
MKPTCPWAMHISRGTVQDHWCVKTLRYQHQCFESKVIGLYTQSTIAKEIEATIDTNPLIPVKELRDEIQNKHKIHVSEAKMRRAKLDVTYKKDGDFRKQYGILNKYCEELLRANPGTTVQIDVEPCCDPSSPTRQFRRIYICYAGMKSGFKMCGREILGLDRCSIQDPFPGQILTAVGIDGNNGIYPVAFALVEAETDQSWTWFLKCLGDDFDLPTNASFTFISDGQKGLIPALERVFPNAEHRYCLKHIRKNMKKQWGGDVFKSMLLRAASATSLPYYINAMEDIRKADTSLFKWLEQIPAKSWSRAHFSGSAKCDILLNSICDEFNKHLIGATDKPVITCLEYIREYMTKRIVNVRKLQADAAGPLTPYAQSLFETIQSEASQLTVMMVDDAIYQVNGVGTTQCVVNVELKTCTCRKWDLTGMPCKHAVVAIRNMAENGMNVGVPENWVDEAYWLDTWKKVYANQISAIPGPDMWTPSECTTTLTPPKRHEQNGEPNKKRRRSSLDERRKISTAEKRKKSMEEVERVFSSGGQMTRKGHFKTCQKCGNKDHNVRTCKAVGGTGTSLQIDVMPVSDCL